MSFFIMLAIYFSTEFRYSSEKDIYREFSNDDENLEYPVKLTKKEVIEEPEVGEEPENDLTDVFKKSNNTPSPVQDKFEPSPITGNVIDNSGDEEGGFGFTTIILVVILAIIAVAIFILVKKNTICNQKAP